MKLRRILQYGTTGDDVKYLQQRLSELKYADYLPTGNFGPQTKESVVKFQRDNNLEDDGKVGNITWSALFKSGVIAGNSISINPIRTQVTKSIKFPYKPAEITMEGLEIYEEILPDDEYIKTPTKKKTIYLHHTAGGHRADWTIKSWDRDGTPNKPYRIATSYVIGGKSSSDGDKLWDGRVFRSFDDKYWSYHLGVSGTNGSYDKSSIGIELCNYGYCRLIDGKFINYVNREIPKEDIVDLGENFRGYRYWHKYTDDQIENLRKLLVYLIDKHDIKIESGIYNRDWFNYDNDKLKGSGIRTHVQVRNDKTDCFPQKELIDMLNTL